MVMGQSGEDAAPELHQAITLYLPPDTDREQVGRLVKAMCNLNGLTVAIELHQSVFGSRDEP